MRVLFDQNLSRRLVDELESSFPDSAHVEDVALDAASDREIWTYAAEHDYVIVSKDSDFRQLAFLLGPPPKAVWLRIGNRSTAAITDFLRANADVIDNFPSPGGTMISVGARFTPRSRRRRQAARCDTVPETAKHAAISRCSAVRGAAAIR